MKQIIFVLILLILASSAHALYPWFVGTAQTASNGQYLCDKQYWPSPPHITPFRGEELVTTLDLNNPANLPVINALGTSFIMKEFCAGKKLIEFACGHAYPQLIGNEVVAVQVEPQDLAQFGANTQLAWECVDHVGTPVGTQPGFVTNSEHVPAYYAPKIIGQYNYPTSQNDLAPNVGGSGGPWPGQSHAAISNPVPGESIDLVVLLDLQGNPVLMSGPCNIGAQCSTPSQQVPAGTYFVIALQSNNLASVKTVNFN